MRTDFIKRMLVPCAAGIAMLAVSCSSDDGVEDATGPVEVRFGSEMASPTRTTEGGNQWTAGDRVGIFMMKHGQGLAAIAEGADNRLYKADTGNNATTSFSPASDAETMYYPQNGDAVDFVAYYPFKTPLDNYKYPIDATDQSQPDQLDVLYAKAGDEGSGYNKRSVAVELAFGHAMSKLRFTLTPGIGAPDLTGATVTVSNISTTGTMDLRDGVVTTTNSGSGVTVPTDTGNSAEVIALPQRLYGAKLTVTLADGVSRFEWNFSYYANLEKGKIHPYNITVSKTHLIVVTGQISDWNGKDAAPTEGRTGYRIGDYYPDPKVNISDPVEKAKIKGVVFWVDPADGRHGKIVDLQMRDTIRWGVNYWATTVGLFDRDNGMNNMDRLIRFMDSEDIDYTYYGRINSTFPAALWVHINRNGGGIHNYYTDHEAKGIWYVPAINELSQLAQAASYYGKDAFNNRLTAAGGREFRSDPYWSCTELQGNRVYMEGWDYARGETKDLHKRFINYHCRAISKF